jgi:hypothetical protein
MVSDVITMWYTTVALHVEMDGPAKDRRNTYKVLKEVRKAWINADVIAISAIDVDSLSFTALSGG